MGTLSPRFITVRCRFTARVHPPGLDNEVSHASCTSPSRVVWVAMAREAPHRGNTTEAASTGGWRAAQRRRVGNRIKVGLGAIDGASARIARGREAHATIREMGFWGFERGDARDSLKAVLPAKRQPRRSNAWPVSRRATPTPPMKPDMPAMLRGGCGGRMP